MPQAVLLVDDVRMFIEIQSEFLKNSPVDILTASDGAEALEIIKSRRPDLVFMDLQMPNMDGVSCCRAVKSDPSIAETPVIIVTSAGSPDSRKSCSASGCDEFLSKPLDRDQFLAMARKYIPGIERRELRKACSLPCDLRLVNMSTPGLLLNVSIRGAYVASETRIAVKDVVRISFCLPEGTQVVCFARVCWVNTTGSVVPRGFGIEFALLPKPAQDALTAFINDQPGTWSS
jgi:CheY-like chemotaxis protein